MIILYFVLFCIIIGLLNWFIIIPLSEKESVKTIIKKIKSILDIIIDWILAFYIIYTFVATLSMTTDLLNKQLNINNSGILALLIISILTYGCIKRFNDNK